MNDTGSGAIDLLCTRLRIGLPRLHERYARLAHCEGAGEVGIDVRLPLIECVWIFHRLAIFPLRAGNTSIVDEDVNAVVEELRRLFDLGADVFDVSQVADCKVDLLLIIVLLEVYLCCVLQLFLIYVEYEDRVATFEEHAT